MAQRNIQSDEWKNQRSQFVIFSQDTRKYKPFVFTEHGILILSSVLNSARAIEKPPKTKQIGFGVN